MTGSQCHICLWYISGIKCKAFPEGIPSMFYLNIERHDKEVKGQVSGFVFEDKNKPEE